MQDIYNRIQQMNIDYVEYFHLKILLLCRWGKQLIQENKFVFIFLNFLFF